VPCRIDDRALGHTLLVKVGQLDSLLDVVRRAPDPWDSNTRYRIGPVLTLIDLALLAGRRKIAEIACFAKILKQPQRRRLSLPRKKRNQWRRDALIGEAGSRSRNATLLADLALLRKVLLRMMAEELETQSLPGLREHLHSHPAFCLTLLARS
jgi:hypothetical protein